MTDKPKVHFSFAELDSEIENPEPFVYTTKASKRVTFPDLFAMEADEGEKFLYDLRTKPDGEILKEWLSDKDRAALAEDKLTLRARTTLLQRVMAYYEGTFGTSGEEPASAS